MNKSIQQFSDAELIEVIQRAENAHVPGGLYQRAQKKWEARQSQKGMASLARHYNRIFVASDGEVKAPEDPVPSPQKNWYKKLSEVLTVPMVLVLGV